MSGRFIQWRQGLWHPETYVAELNLTAIEAILSQNSPLQKSPNFVTAMALLLSRDQPQTGGGSNSSSCREWNCLTDIKPSTLSSGEKLGVGLKSMAHTNLPKSRRQPDWRWSGLDTWKKIEKSLKKCRRRSALSIYKEKQSLRAALSNSRTLKNLIYGILVSIKILQKEYFNGI